MSITYLQHIMESFYLCSHLPICCVDRKGHLLLATGFSSQLTYFIKETSTQKKTSFSHEISQLILSNQLILEKENHAIYTPKQNVHFSLCPVIPHDLSQGFYIIGPYTSHFSLKDDYLLKPLHCMKPLIQLLYTFQENEPPSSHFQAQPECSYHIEKAKTYIDTHYQETITLDQLARHLELNSSYLCTLFSKVMNDSFSHYTNKVRIEKSKQLLTETTQSILDIGLSVGFSSGSYYNTLFKRSTGLTPLEYRKQYTKAH